MHSYSVFRNFGETIWPVRLRVLKVSSIEGSLPAGDAVIFASLRSRPRIRVKIIAGPARKTADGSGWLRSNNGGGLITRVELSHYSTHSCVNSPHFFIIRA